MHETDQTAEDIHFWLSKSPGERLAAVTYLTVHSLPDSLQELKSQVIEGKEIFYPLFKSLFHSLNNCKVEYLTVGGYAMAYFGLPRYSNDLDIWVNPARLNMSLLSSALIGLNRERLLEAMMHDIPQEVSVRLGTKPMEVDIHLNLGQLDFNSAFANREVVEISGIQVPFISKADFVVNKLASTRIQDLVDGKIIQSGRGREE
ncbi:hypothetical protein GCM10007423_63890 [Dyadobacter endophyticus]|uniref:Nucleotidyl transferase AbiEii toxin, Type IV TA system n=2 Tax=Dyadobacter endophyticus TaxID=1749036 RepID=A0ABQ1ZC30_9BACT|nr:hypothetical protein GCM10007423_63890 [Dyadobacter endophyticus]